MPSQRLRRRAQRIARAQARPARQAQRAQIRGTRRDTRQTVHSLGSENRGVQSAISRAGHDFRTIPGLTGRDQRIALEQLATMRGTTAAGIASEKTFARREGQQAISDLRAAMPQPDVASALQDLLSQRMANRHDVKMAKLGARLDAKAASAAPKLTPYERHGIREDKSTAVSLARSALKDYMKAANKHGHALPPPNQWNDARWQHYADALVTAYPSQLSGNLATFAVRTLKKRYRRSAHGIERGFTSPGVSGTAGIG